MIVEQRDYHVYTGKLPELLRLYERGDPLQQEILGGLVGAFDRRGRALHLLDALALRVLRRAEARAPAGRQPLAGLPAPRAAAHAHAAEPPSRRSADVGRRTARSRSSRALPRESAARSRGARRRGARIVVVDLDGAEEAAAAFPDGVAIVADVASEEDTARMAREAVERCRGIDILVNNAGLYASLRCGRSPRSHSRSGGG